MTFGPTWLAATFAAVMLTTALYGAARLVAARRWHRALHYDVNLAHVAMGVAMAGMLAASLKTLPNAAWEAVFAGFALWFGWKSATFVARYGVRGTDAAGVHHVSHYLAHLVMSIAMLYMYVAMPTAALGATSSAASGMVMGPGGTAKFGSLAALLALAVLVSAIWHTDGVARFAPAPVADQVPATVGAPSASAVSIAEVVGAPQSQPRWLAPRLECACHVAMCVAMAYMLILMR